MSGCRAYVLHVNNLTRRSLLGLIFAGCQTRSWRNVCCGSFLFIPTAGGERRSEGVLTLLTGVTWSAASFPSSAVMMERKGEEEGGRGGRRTTRADRRSYSQTSTFRPMTKKMTSINHRKFHISNHHHEALDVRFCWPRCILSQWAAL